MIAPASERVQLVSVIFVFSICFLTSALIMFVTKYELKRKMTIENVVIDVICDELDVSFSRLKWANLRRSDPRFLSRKIQISGGKQIRWQTILLTRVKANDKIKIESNFPHKAQRR